MALEANIVNPDSAREHEWAIASDRISIGRNYLSMPLSEKLFQEQYTNHGDVTKWKYCPRYWPFVRGIHRWPVYSPHIGQWRGTLMFTLICAWINGWVNNRGAGDLRRHRAHYNVTVMHWSFVDGIQQPNDLYVHSLYSPTSLSFLAPLSAIYLQQNLILESSCLLKNRSNDIVSVIWT